MYCEPENNYAELVFRILSGMHPILSLRFQAVHPILEGLCQHLISFIFKYVHFAVRVCYTALFFVSHISRATFKSFFICR